MEGQYDEGNNGVRNRETPLLLASKLGEAPKSKLKAKVNSKEQNIGNLVNIRSCGKAFLSEADFMSFFFWKRLYMWAKLGT
jgi:hypothetical protein